MSKPKGSKGKVTDRDAHFKAKQRREAYAKNKITDKERLDWLTKKNKTYKRYYSLHAPDEQDSQWVCMWSSGKSPRAAIDAALRQERKSKGGSK